VFKVIADNTIILYYSLNSVGQHVFANKLMTLHEKVSSYFFLRANRGNHSLEETSFITKLFREEKLREIARRYAIYPSMKSSRQSDSDNDTVRANNT